MLRVGDTVAHFFAMHRPGKIHRIIEKAAGNWMIGGVSAKSLFAEVQHFDNGDIVEYALNDLRQIDS
jgi:hypothetical protein